MTVAGALVKRESARAVGLADLAERIGAAIPDAAARSNSAERNTAATVDGHHCAPPCAVGRCQPFSVLLLRPPFDQLSA